MAAKLPIPSSKHIIIVKSFSLAVTNPYGIESFIFYIIWYIARILLEYLT